MSLFFQVLCAASVLTPSKAGTYIIHLKGFKNDLIHGCYIYWGRKEMQNFWTARNSNITKIFEPAHDKTNRMACAPSEDSDHPGHPPSLIRVFAVFVPAQSDHSLRCARNRYPRFLHVDSEDSYQTGRMPRLIWVFVGRTCHFVGFVMRWLKNFIFVAIRIYLFVLMQKVLQVYFIQKTKNFKYTFSCEFTYLHPRFTH